ncbi:chemotaxis response regulator protein-glutamate methylesterase [Bacterioplanoides sp. SCSIO 12839]|uniref:protein-glutamate methylesterase/protein-glutamine glutaminase n=1 Tax=Bacterioplanoides sp. SCSIO 12839 TaxID=2829569 RepID=UPI002106D503|nr:chemotaxis response regulator protein-glutamate methylesterase [Bacterioplanoides sp. SCSIO 12839]UTW48956.1 chemotaxis response regulator protein-glutamate methylesterase [Bacterioplanoides sp. SCSIO 12839]
MTIRVLVVDDSGFFRRRVSEIINADGRMEVVGDAANGREAVELNESLKPDVITMDYEMPVMDGITAVRTIMQQRPVPILMFSSLTFEGARVTLDALDAGALDFLSKNFDAIAKGTAEVRKALTNKIAGVAKNQTRVMPSAAAPVAPKPVGKKELVMIGTSTGGPAALQTLFKAIPAGFKTPIVIVQHMPGSFTKAFAERLNAMSPLTVKEAEEGDLLKPGHVYVAPGGMQLMVDKRNGGSIHIHESDQRVNYRPSVDIAFASAAKHFGRSTLGVVLTGMGSDGKEGARLLKQAGSTIWAQDEESSVIFGMPLAVIKEGLSDDILPLSDVGPRLSKDIG